MFGIFTGDVRATIGEQLTSIPNLRLIVKLKMHGEWKMSLSLVNEVMGTQCQLASVTSPDYMAHKFLIAFEFAPA